MHCRLRRSPALPLRNVSGLCVRSVAPQIAHLVVTSVHNTMPASACAPPCLEGLLDVERTQMRLDSRLSEVRPAASWVAG